MRGLQGPHATLEPVNQFKVVRRAAEEGLTEMHVRLHEAGQNGAPARVNRQVRRAGRVADRGDAPVAHEHVARDNRVRGIHRDDDAAFD